MNHSIDALKRETDRFISLHWKGDYCKEGPDQLEWRTWNMQGAMPHQEKQGCYALLSGDTIVYIGSGTSRGGGRYAGWGLGSRVTTHTRLSKKGKLEDRAYEPNVYWKEKGVTGLMTFGFPEGFGYLALALEAYLISKLSPEFNVTFSAVKKVDTAAEPAI